MRVSVRDVGQHGIVRDVDPIRLPPNAWTDGKNINFSYGEVTKSSGYSEFLDPTPTDVHFIVPVAKYSGGIATINWVYAGLTNAYAYDGTEGLITRYTTTPGDNNYTGSAADRWNSCINQGVFYLNNGKDVPQEWTGDVLQDLQWDSTHTWDDKGYLTRVIRNYKNHLVGLGWYDGSKWNPHSVYWSSPAEPFTVPESWDFTDPSTLAGVQDLTTTPGELVDGQPLRDYFMIYKEDGMVVMSNVGGQYVMGFRDLSKTTGILCQGGVQEFFGQHFVLANDDVVVTDGNSIKSVIDGKLRKKLFTEIDTTYYKNSFIIPYFNKTEMRICYPSSGSSYPDMALVWNWTDDSWSIRELGTLVSADVGIAPSGTSDNWDDDTETWDSDSTAWDLKTYNPSVKTMLGTDTSKIYLLEDTYTDNGTSFESYVTKEWIKLGQTDTIKRITAIYPKGSGEMNVYVGYAMHQNDPFTWEGPYNITPEEDAQIRCRVTGRYHAVKFEFVGDTAHTLQGYDIEYVDTGQGR